MPIQRMTCFKVKNDSDIAGLIDQYQNVSDTNQKVWPPPHPPTLMTIASSSAPQDGKPYILETSSRKAIDDPRNPGYNLVGITKFASMDDVKYYDEACEAHQKLKAFAMGKVDGPPLVLHLEV
ncbi:hypothetical protein LTR53_015465 [Teratosphaeriaceae sp. CCFEE 6253]|nr:hypothetical protein LTR53_015465 [Teratosphaeriaceae sp. CCFEE 6253]